MFAFEEGQSVQKGDLLAEIDSRPYQAVLQQMQGLMSVLEGHGDITMDRAAADRIPSAGRFRDVLHERRQANGTVRFVQRLVGLEAKLRQYQEGEEFLEAIELSCDQDILICGDRRDDKAELAELVERIDGLRAVDCGRLEMARITESLTAMLIAVNSRYKVHAGIRLTDLGASLRE